jgi:hypothetical protein
MARVRGSRVKFLRLRDLWCRPSLYGLSVRFLEHVFLANRELLSSQWTRLAEARTATNPGPGSDAGVPLFVSQRVAVLCGGGTEASSGADLGGGARVAGIEIGPAKLFAFEHPPDPIAAPTALAGALQTLS